MLAPVAARFVRRPLLATTAALVLLAALIVAARALIRSGDECGCRAVHNDRLVIHTVQESIVHYRADHDDRCPPSLRALVDGRYLTKLPRDQRGRLLRLSCASAHAPGQPQVISAGAAGRFDTADDIDSWSLE